MIGWREGNLSFKEKIWWDLNEERECKDFWEREKEKNKNKRNYFY